MTNAKTKHYLMPVIVQNLAPAETYNQVVDNISYLCNVIDEAFNTIETTLNEEKKKIRNNK